MTLARSAVAVVIDPDFGWELRSLAEEMPVHVVDSPANRPAIESVWNDRRTRGVDRDVTVFRPIPGLAPEEHLYGVLRALVADWRPVAPDEGIRILHIVGLPLTPAIERALRTLGLGDCRATPNGFRTGVRHPSAGADKAGS